MKRLSDFFNLFLKPQTLNYKKDPSTRPNARGVPVPLQSRLSHQCLDCKSCEEICPTQTLRIHTSNPTIKPVSSTSESKPKNPLMVSIDYGACLQCGLCTDVCPDSALVNSNFVDVFSLSRQELKCEFKDGEMQEKDFQTEPTESINAFRKLAKRSGFSYREIAAGGNNSVECELNASFNAVFDSESQGIKCVASPKHADALVYSGPISKGMAAPLQTAWNCIPGPKALIACGTEAISGGLFERGPLPKEPDLYIGGDPPSPNVIIHAFRFLLGRAPFSFRKALSERIAEIEKKLKGAENGR